MKVIVSIIILFIYSYSAFGQQYTLSGYVTGEDNGEALIGATVYDQRSGKGAVTNVYGFYSLSLPQDSVALLVRYPGYEPYKERLFLEKDLDINFKLQPSGNSLDEVVVTGNRSDVREQLNSTQMSAIKLLPAQMASLPAIGGEVDVIKIAQLMPGISGGTQGTSGMYVRGGTQDQNLVVLDEATVYNLSHLFGFFSVFNNDALKDIQIIKGGFPANYGGRLSSIMDIRMNEGNMKKFHVQGGIGLLSSRATIEGPVIKDKMSFMLSGRRTYIDKVFQLAGTKIPYFFYDLNTKVNYRFSDKDRLYFSSYFGNDVLKISEEVDSDDNIFGFGFKLGNFTYTLRWNHRYNPKLFSNVSLIHTRFRYSIEGEAFNNSVFIGSNIRDVGIKADWDYYPNPENRVKFGLSVINHDFRPNIITTNGEISEVLKGRVGRLIRTQEMGLYASNDYEIDSSWKINYGVRISAANIKDSFYTDVEPRTSLRYSFNEIHSLKLSYSRMKQYMHLVSSSAVSLPTDLWYPVTKKVQPLTADQVAFGYFTGIEKANLIFSVEAYYKWMQHLIEYKEGARLVLNDDFEEELLSGKGNAYGLEFLIRKNKGKLSGWIGYTLSWAKRHFAELNDGDPFFAKYDRRHDLSFVGTWDISRRLTFSAIWVYATGARFTAQIGQYLLPRPTLTGIDVMPIYSKRNAVQMSPSHRLDVNLIIKRKPERKFKGEWHIGAYNVYNYATPFSIDIVPADNGGYKYQQPGLFGFLPSIAYNFKF